MSQLLILLPSLPVTVPVEKNTVPNVALVPAPLIVQFVIVLFVASAMKRIAVGVAADRVFSIVSELLPVFKPLIVTLSAPFKSIRCPAIAPLTVLAAPPEGDITIEV